MHLINFINSKGYGTLIIIILYLVSVIFSIDRYFIYADLKMIQVFYTLCLFYRFFAVHFTPLF